MRGAHRRSTDTGKLLHPAIEFWYPQPHSSLAACTPPRNSEQLYLFYTSHRVNAMHPRISYLICSTPRSGSTLLGEALTNTGLAGEPREYFLRSDEPVYARDWDVSTEYPEYFYEVLARATTPNGVFGAKIMWSDFVRLTGTLSGSLGVWMTSAILPKLNVLNKEDYVCHYQSRLRALPRYPRLRKMGTAEFVASSLPNLHYIHIVRQDKVRQAISAVKNEQTKIPWVRDGERPLPARQPYFDFRRIDRYARRLELDEAAWTAYFDYAGVRPYVVVYEDFVSLYEETALDILSYLGVTPPANLRFKERRLQRQADDVTEEWLEKYWALKRTHAS